MKRLILGIAIGATLAGGAAAVAAPQIVSSIPRRASYTAKGELAVLWGYPRAVRFQRCTPETAKGTLQFVDVREGVTVYRCVAS